MVAPIRRRCERDGRIAYAAPTRIVPTSSSGLFDRYYRSAAITPASAAIGRQ
jgi:hypothetical protein